MGLKRSKRRPGLLSTAEHAVEARQGRGSPPEPAAEVAGRGSPPEQQAPLRIIGVDPGLASTGWGVIESSRGKLKYIAHGCIETAPDKLRGERLFYIYQSFQKVLKTHKPAKAAMENLYFGKNISSAMAVAEARGILHMALTAQAIPVLELTPNAIKKAVVGVTRADKNQVQEMVRFLLGLSEIPEPDHAADALAAAICAANYPTISDQEES